MSEQVNQPIQPLAGKDDPEKQRLLERIWLGAAKALGGGSNG